MANRARNCLCVVSFLAAAEPEAREWLRGVVAEGLERAFPEETAAEAQGGRAVGMAGLFQTIHEAVFKTRRTLTFDFREVSAVAACFSKARIEVAGAGGCAGYLVGASRVERLVPPETRSAGDPSYLGGTARVSVELVRRTPVGGESYVLTAAALEEEADLARRFSDAVGASDQSAQAMALTLFGDESHAMGIVEFRAEESRCTATGAGWRVAGRRLKRVFSPLSWKRRQPLPPPEAEEEMEKAALPEEDLPDEGLPQETRDAVAGEIVPEEGLRRETPDVVVPGETVPEEAAALFEGEKAVQEGEIDVSQEEADVSQVIGGPRTADEPEAARPALHAAEGEPGSDWTEWERIMDARAERLARTDSASWRRIAGISALGLVLAAGGYLCWRLLVEPMVVPFLREHWRLAAPAKEARFVKGTLSLSSFPEGAEIVLNDTLVSSRTPTYVTNLSPGSHNVTMRLSDYGEWAGEISLAAGDTARVSVFFAGQISVSSRPVEGLSVLLDGEPRGHTPCILDSVSVGPHVVAVEGEGFSRWEEEVVVTHGGVSQVDVAPGKLPKTGQLSVAASMMTEEGYEELRGRRVYVDGKSVGVTPYKAELTPGIHSVRVDGPQGHNPSVTVVTARAGGRHFVQPEFGSVEAAYVQCSEVRPSGSRDVIVCASLVGGLDATVSRASLCVERTGGGQSLWQTMSLVPGSQGVYATAIPRSLLQGDSDLRYFAKVVDSQGLEYFSEIRSSRVRSQ
ncbi:MAG: PEGA domain-containing protein [Candidatus Eisenbacteria bacterium]